MKRRVSLLVMLILAVSLVFVLSACGECEHEQTETKTEVTFEGDCVVPQRYDEVVYCVECDEEISRKSYNGKCADHDPKAPVPENVDMLDCTVGGVADMVVYCNNSRCNAVISRTEGVAIEKATAHTLKTKLIFDEKQKECNSEIWIDVYDIVRLLSNHRSSIKKTQAGWTRVYPFVDLDIEEYPEE